MRRFSTCPLYRGTAVLLGQALLCVMVAAGCADVGQRHREAHPNPYLTSDTRHPIPLSTSAGKEHRAVMLQHLETIQAIVNALVVEDYELAQGLAESHLGYFTHRQAKALQELGKFLPAYHDLTMAHHEAAGELARSISTRDLKQILPPFNNVVKTCVACHLEYKVSDRS
jgi:hypothetical protein